MYTFGMNGGIVVGNDGNMHCLYASNSLMFKTYKLVIYIRRCMIVCRKLNLFLLQLESTSRHREILIQQLLIRTYLQLFVMLIRLSSIFRITKLFPETETLNNFCPSRFSQVCSDFHFIQIANIDTHIYPTQIFPSVY